MGVDCTVTLPPGTRINDLANVLGMLLGCEGHMSKIPAWHVDGVDIRVSSVPACDIYIRTPRKVWHFFYHFEWGTKGERGFYMASNDRNKQIAKGVVDFFGGQVDYDDCDDIQIDYAVFPKPDIHAEDGDEWDALQVRMSRVMPLVFAEET